MAAFSGPRERSMNASGGVWMYMRPVLTALLEYILRIDTLTAELIAEFRTPLATKLLTSVTGLGSASAAVVLLGLFYLAGWKSEFLYTLVALLISGVIVGTLMMTVQRPFPPQPVCMTGGAETVAQSFPSGHAAAVAVYAMVARRSDNLPFKTATALAVLIAVSRVYLGTHYLSDTVVGVGIGVVSVIAATRLLGRLESNERIERYLAAFDSYWWL